MSALAAFVARLVFGIGLIVSGMADPGKVTGFLDLMSKWDPSLAFVMGGAMIVGLFAFAFAQRGMIIYHAAERFLSEKPFTACSAVEARSGSATR